MSADPLRSMDGFSTLLDALHEGFQVIGTDFRYLYVNAAAAKHGHTTRAALLGRTMPECYPGIDGTEMWARLTRCMRDRTSEVFENEFAYEDGQKACFELRMEPVPQGVCVLSIDITERKESEERARERAEEHELKERLESVGRLSAGIAHDFNNLLGVILGFGELALARPDHPTREDVDSMMDAAQRAAELTRQLLAYGRRQVLRKRVIDPVALVSGLEVLLSRTLGSHIELGVRVAPPVSFVEVDPSQLEQVVMNLVLNARDAMPEGGRITISLSTVERRETHTEIASHTGPNGSYLLLAVSDTGVGMSAATRARIFDPFFTTKDLGKGTGLGLATVYGIVKQSGGDIWVHSEPGRGTTFEILLPSAQKQKAPISEQTRAPREALPERKDRATILVAEDDASLRKLTAFSLEAQGHGVIVAASGDEALTHVRSHDPIDLLITDVMMPGMRGTDLITAARKLRPNLCVICTSGHERSAIEGASALDADVVFLVKPFLPSKLVAEVAELLRARAC